MRKNGANVRSIDSPARRKTETETKVKMSNKRCCPKCGSGNIDCMDGAGMITEHGGGIMLDISPEMWICGDCGEVFRVELFEDSEQAANAE